MSIFVRKQSFALHVLKSGFFFFQTFAFLSSLNELAYPVNPVSMVTLVSPVYPVSLRAVNTGGPCSP